MTAPSRADRPASLDTWRSGPDRFRHAYAATSRGSRAICGAPLADERWHRHDDPRHPECERLVAEQRAPR
jgi:hypothetical protein